MVGFSVCETFIFVTTVRWQLGLAAAYPNRAFPKAPD
jgi:hypothetical protein